MPARTFYGSNRPALCDPCGCGLCACLTHRCHHPPCLVPSQNRCAFAGNLGVGLLIDLAENSEQAWVRDRETWSEFHCLVWISECTFELSVAPLQLSACTASLFLCAALLLCNSCTLARSHCFSACSGRSSYAVVSSCQFLNNLGGSALQVGPLSPRAHGPSTLCFRG